MTRLPADDTIRRHARPRLVLGIMSGTSLDGVDYALCSVSECKVRLRAHWRAGFPERLLVRLNNAARGISRTHELAQLHHDLGRFYAEHAHRRAAQSRLHLVGLHGQTVFHNPKTRFPATLQLGEPAYLAETLCVPVVNNFRAADLAASGQGAPLATLFHEFIFGERGKHVCVNNLGGISNVTSIDWRRGRKPRLNAFDTGPANMLIDLAVQALSGGRQRFDENGDWARRGTLSEDLLKCWLKHPYLAQAPPKSTGRELFGEPFLTPILVEAKKRRLSNFDLVANLCEFTARSIALNYRLHLSSLPQRVVLAGGGAANPCLVRRIREALQRLDTRIKVETCEELGWPCQAVEPAAFALLAYYRLMKKPGNRPATTGARRSVVLGQISEP